METLSFTFGILTMVAIIIVVTAVVGIVKVVKQQAQLKRLEKDIEWIGNRFDNERRDLETLLNNVETSTDGRFYELERHANNITDVVNLKIDKDNEQIYYQINETRSYIDSRIDKLEAKKQLIKG